jgi:hypothetical protein
MKSLALAAIAALTLTGCGATAAIEKNRPAATIVVQGAALAYIKEANPAERAARAVRVLKAVEAIRNVANGEPITLQRLVQVAIEQIPLDGDPADRLIAMNVINLAQAYLQDSIGAGGLESDSLLLLPDVLEWISIVARLYTTPS